MREKVNSLEVIKIYMETILTSFLFTLEGDLYLSSILKYDSNKVLLNSYHYSVNPIVKIEINVFLKCVFWYKNINY